LAAASARRPQAKAGRFSIGSYVRAKGRTGRVVGLDGDRYAVQFYDYSDKSVAKFAAGDLAVANMNSSVATRAPIADQKPDCQVEWKGTWFDAIVLKEEGDRWQIHYIGYDDSWDERVGRERFRPIKEPKAR
jgi:hypothetical protein